MLTAEGFAVVELRGSDHEMGRERGRRLRGEVRRALAVRLGAVCQLLPVAPEQALALAARRAGACRAACPAAAEEVEGLAEGAGLTLDEAWFLQTWAATVGVGRYSTCCLASGGWASRSGEVLVGLNRDAAPWLVEPMTVVRRIPRNGPPSLQVLHHGEVAGGGLNGAGVVCFDIANGHAGEGAAPPVEWLCRAALGHESAEEAAEALAAYPAAAGAAAVLGDANAGLLACLEWGAAKPRLAYSGSGLFARAGKAGAEEDEADSEAERSRIRETRVLLMADQQRGGVDAAVVRGILADHQNYPSHSVCRHNAGPDRLSTLASFVADAGEGALQACLGPPCAGEYRTIEL